MKVDFRKLALALAAVLGFSGCVTSAMPRYASTCSGETGQLEKKSVAYTFRRMTRLSSDGGYSKIQCGAPTSGCWAAPQPEATALGQFREAFGPWAKVIADQGSGVPGEADVTMEIVQQNGWDPVCLLGGLVSGFTLGLVPCWGDDAYVLHVEARDRHGRQKTYEVESVVTTVVWTPLILAAPFTSLPVTRVNEVTRAHWEELRRRMMADGFFAAASSPEAAKVEDRKAALGRLLKEGLLTEAEYCQALERLGQ